MAWFGKRWRWSAARRARDGRVAALEEQIARLARQGEDQRATLIGLRNEVVKLRIEVDQRVADAETQTQALFERIEAARHWQPIDEASGARKHR